MNKYCSVFATVAFSLFLLPCNSIAQQYRLVKETSEYKDQLTAPSTFMFYDSATYTYQWQSGRGSTYNNDTIRFDVSYHYGLQGASQGEETKTVRTYTASNILLTSTTYEYDPLLNIWDPFKADSFTVSNNGQVLEWRRYTTYNGSNSMFDHYWYKYSYDAQGRLLIEEVQEIVDTTRPNMPSPPKWRCYYRYGSNGNLLADSTVYQYAQGVWRNESRTEYHYDAGGNKVRVDVYDVDGVNGLVGQSFYNYNASGLLVKDSIVRFFSLGKGYQVLLYTYNTQGQLVADTFRSNYLATVWPISIYSYTPFGDLSEKTLAHTDSNARSVVIDGRLRYYYQLYWPTGVEETSSKSADITLYPNPATNVLHINTSEEYTQARIYNSMGQMVKLVNANSEQVNVSDLPAGNYYLQLSSSGGAVKRSFVIVR